MAIHEWILTIFVAVTAIAVVIQVLILLAVSKALIQVAKTMERIQDSFEKEVHPVLHTFNEFVTAASGPTRKILDNLSVTSDLLRVRAQAADALAAEVIERARVEVQRADQFITGSIEMLQRASEAVERGIMVPVKEVTALVAGLRQGIGYFFRRRGAEARSGAPSEEQLFI